MNRHNINQWVTAPCVIVFLSYVAYIFSPPCKWNFLIGLCAKGIVQPLLTLHMEAKETSFLVNWVIEKAIIVLSIMIQLVESSCFFIQSDWSIWRLKAWTALAMQSRSFAMLRFNQQTCLPDTNKNGKKKQLKVTLELEKLALKLFSWFSWKPIQLQSLKGHLKSFMADSTEWRMLHLWPPFPRSGNCEASALSWRRFPPPPAKRFSMVTKVLVLCCRRRVLNHLHINPSMPTHFAHLGWINGNDVTKPLSKQ